MVGHLNDEIKQKRPHLTKKKIYFIKKMHDLYTALTELAPAIIICFQT